MPKHRILRSFALCLVMLVGALLFAPRLWGAQPGAELDTVWARVAASGGYRFRADVTQTSMPAATVRNAGQRSRTTTMYMDGTTDLDAETMDLTLWSNGGSALDPASGVEIRIDGDTARARQGSGPWEEIDDFTGLFAPGGDFMAYTRAATDVVQHPPTLRSTPLGDIMVTRYTFAIDGRRYAAQMLATMQAQAIAEGLPSHTHFDLPRFYRDMTGAGELLVGADGLPLQQSFTLHFPPSEDKYTTTAEIRVDFSDFAKVSGLATGVSASIAGSALRNAWILRDGRAVGEQGPTLAVLLLVGLCLALFLRHRHRRAVYGTVVGGVILSMLTVSLFSSHRIYAYSTHQAAQQARQATQRAEMDRRADIAAWQAEPSIDPHTDALAAVQQELATPQSAQLATEPDYGRYFDPICETDPNGDKDGDTLTNLEECLLGTLPEEVDTDQDGVADNVEVTGFQLPGSSETWYTDPTEMDTNRDGIGDGQEWYTDANGNQVPDDTDGDGVPDLWDEDNDGDAVPDDLDMSLSTQTQTSHTFSADDPLQLTLNDLTPENLVTVEFQLKPTNPDHLWYSFNVLDWPVNDRRGHLQDIDGATFADLDPNLSPSPNANGDMRMVPVLEIQMPVDSPNLPPPGTCSGDDGEEFACYPLLNQFGISTQQVSDDVLAAYVPLQLVSDGNGHENVAFYGRMLYQAGGLWQAAHQVRLVWVIQMLNDVCAEFKDDVCAEYSELNDLTIIQTYEDDWYLTGLTVTEERGADTALVYEDPARTAGVADGYDEPLYIDTLYSLVYGLDVTFMAARDCDTTDSNGDCVGNGQRDVTVAEIERRFDAATNAGVSEEERWALPNVLGVDRHTYDSGDLALFDTTITRTVGLLDEVYTGVWTESEPITPTVMYVSEDSYRALNLDEFSVGNDNLGWNGNALTVDLAQSGDNAVQVETTATVKWTPYRYDPVGGWAPADMETFIETLDVELADIFDNMDESDTASAYRTMAQVLYITVYNGNVSVVQNGSKLYTDDYAKPDTALEDAILNGVGTLLIIGVEQYFAVTEELLAITEAYLAQRRIGMMVIDGPQSRFLKIQAARYGHKVVALALLAFIAIAVVTLITVLIVKLAGQDQWAGWDVLSASALLTITLILGIIAPLRAAYEAAGIVVTWGAYAKQLTTVTKLKSFAGKAAIIGLIITILVAIGIFVWVWATNDNVTPGTVAFNLLLATTIASIIVAVLFFIIALTVIGAVILAIIVVIDTILYLAGVDFSINNAITQFFAMMIYRFSIHEPTIDAGALRAELQDVDRGYTAGNQVNYTLPITTSLYSLFGPVTSRALDGSLIYSLDEEERELSTSAGARRGDWVTGEIADPFLPYGALWYAQIEDEPSHTTTLIAGPDRPVDLYLNTGYALVGRECWLLWFCKNKTVAGSVQDYVGEVYATDTLPATIDDFANVNAWGGQVSSGPLGNVRFLDPDGDGLLARSQGGLDPNNNRWDTDGDGLSDGYELFVRSLALEEGGARLDPRKADTDGDGVDDATELRFGMNPAKDDTDSDGLSDGEELAPAGGWLLPYRYNAGTQQVAVTRIWSDPLYADSDGDGLSDLFERAELTCPTCDPWADPENPLVYNPNLWNENPLPLYVANDTLDNVVAPGATFLYTTTTSNGLSSGQRIVGELDLTLPDAFEGAPLSANVDIAQGNRQSLASRLTVRAGTSITEELTSGMRLTNFDVTKWLWNSLPGADAATLFGAVQDVAVARPAARTGYFLAVTREVAGNGAQAVVPYQVSSEGLVFSRQTPQPFFTGGTGDRISLPAVACINDSCLAAWRVTNAAAGTNRIYAGRLKTSDAAAVPTTFVVAESAAGTGVLTAPAVATDDSQFMVAWAEAAGANNAIRVRPVAANGTPTGAAQTVTNAAVSQSSVALAWNGSIYRAVWTEGTMLRQARVAANGNAEPAQDLVQGRGWPRSDGSERAPVLVYDALSAQEVVVFRSAELANVVMAQRINAAGRVGNPITIYGNDALVQDDVTVAVSADTQHGGWVVGGSAPGQDAAFYRALGTDGSVRGDVAAGAHTALQAVALVCGLAPSSLVDLELDEPAGATTFADSSGNGRNATCSDACPQSGVSGQFGNAVSFDAVKQQALRVNGVNFANKSFTLSTWLKAPGGNPSGAIISQGALVHVNPGGAVILGAGNGNIYCDLWQLNSTPNLSAPVGDNDWHHWACTFDLPTRQMTLYRDGVVVDATKLQGPTVYIGSGPLYIGKADHDNPFNPFGQFLSGTMERTIIYDRALSAAELNAYALSCQLATADGTAIFSSDNLALTESTTPLGDISRTTTSAITVDSDLPVPTISADYFSRDGDPGYIRSKGTLIVAGEVTDPTSYATRVDVDAGAGMVQAEGTGAWAFAWETANLADGEQTLTIQATDAAGNVNTPASWRTILDNTPPAISIDTASEPGQPYRDQTGRWRVPLLGTVTDPVAGIYPGSGVEQVDVLLQGAGDVDGLGWQSATSAPGLWSLDYALPEVIGSRGSEPTGAYTVTVRATDRVSNTTAAADYVTARLTLDVSGPEVTLTNPLSVTQLVTTDRLVQGTVSDAGDVATVQVNFTPGAQIGALDGAALYHAFDTTLRTEYFSDLSGSNHAAVCAAATCPRMGVAGRRDQAVTFNGIDQLMTIGNAADLNFGPDDDFTVAFWVRPNAQVSQAASHAIVEKWAGAGGYPFAVHYDQATGTIIATRSDSSRQPTVTTDRSIIDNAFHHVAFVGSGGNLTLYLDGVLSGGPVEDTTTGATGNDAAVYLGMRSDGSDAFAGTLDEVVIYDRALAGYEVANLMAYGEGTWAEAALVGDRWSYTIPAGDAGIEGIFQLNVRGIDAVGNATPLSGRRVWRGEIDTKPPSVEFLAATDSSSGETVTRYTCIARDFSLLQESKNNGVQTTSCVPGNPPPRPTFHNSGLTLTTYDQVDPWYAATITDTSRLYQITGVVTLQGEPVQNQTMVACDRYEHCATAAMQTLVTTPEPSGGVVLAPVADTVLTSTQPISVAGQVRAEAGLRSLIVVANEEAVFSDYWPADATTRAAWSFTWTPPGEGIYTFVPYVLDWTGAVPFVASADSAPTAAEAEVEAVTTPQAYLPLVARNEGTAAGQSSSVGPSIYLPITRNAIVLPNTVVGPATTVYVDLAPPEVSLAKRAWTTADALGEQVIELSGTVSDTVGVHRVDVRIDGGPWQRAGIDGDRWRWPWIFAGAPDADQFQVTVRATDLAGRTAEVTDSVMVDLVPFFAGE